MYASVGNRVLGYMKEMRKTLYAQKRLRRFDFSAR